MKAVLNAVKVTANLQRLFPGKQICCTQIIESWNATHYYIETNVSKVVVTNKMVWIKPDIRHWAQYIIFCKDHGIMYQKQRTLIGTCIPYNYIKGRHAKERNNEVDLLLKACGQKTEKNALDDLTRLRQFSAKFYVDVYKLIKEITVIDSKLEYERIYAGYGEYKDEQLLLKVKHTKGSFSFPIENITGNADQDEQIQNIFLNLLGKPVTSKIHELKAA